MAKRILRHTLGFNHFWTAVYRVHNIVAFSVNFKMTETQPKPKGQPPHFDQAAGLEHETPARCVYFLQG